MILSNEEQLMQDLALRQALLALLPELALQNGISPEVTKALAGRLQLPTQQPVFMPEESVLPEDDPPAGDGTEEAAGEEVLPPPQETAQLAVRLDAIAGQLQQLAEAESAGQKELASLRRLFAAFTAGEKDAAADTVLLSVIRVLDSIEASLRREDEERIEFLRQTHTGGADIAHRYMTELQGVRQDLLELLYQNDTEPFTCGGHTLDPRRQQVLARKTAAYATDTPEGEMLLESRRPGYARGERILRREQVMAIQVLPRWMRDGLADGQHEPPPAT